MEGRGSDGSTGPSELKIEHEEGRVKDSYTSLGERAGLGRGQQVSPSSAALRSGGRVGRGWRELWAAEVREAQAHSAAGPPVQEEQGWARARRRGPGAALCARQGSDPRLRKDGGLKQAAKRPDLWLVFYPCFSLF